MGGEEGIAVELQSILKFLKSDWFGTKKTFPVASGGIHPGYVPANFMAFGKDFVINAGGGIHGHPLGTRGGAAAMKQAIEACIKGISIDEYAKTHRELDLALKQWGEKRLSED